MWHDFVMYSEGCGGNDPKPLREAEVAIAHVAEFSRECSPPTAYDTTLEMVEQELEYEEAEAPRA